MEGNFDTHRIDALGYALEFLKGKDVTEVELLLEAAEAIRKYLVKKDI